MFGDDQDELLGARSSSSTDDSSTVLEDEDDAEIYEAGDSEEEEEEDDETTDDDEEESYEVTDDDDFEEDDSLSTRNNEKSVIDVVGKSPFSSMDTRDRFDGTTYSSHSFASEATEERAHVSSPRSPSYRSPRKKNSMISPYSARSVPMTPTAARSVASTTASATMSPGNLSVPSITSTGTSKSALRVRQRVPGGAAAKMIGRPTEDNFHVADDGDDAFEVAAPVEELMKSRDKAKTEFSLGSTSNRRYHAEKDDDDDELQNNESTTVQSKVKSLPTILNRSEVFHENASAAIVSLLSPVDHDGAQRGGIPQVTSSHSDTFQATNTLRPPRGKGKSKTDGLFHPPRRVEDGSVISSARSDVSSAVGNATENEIVTYSDPLVQKMYNKKLDRRLDVMKSRMKDPSQRMTELMTAIATPNDGDLNRHYMVRRKNACGALQVMTSNASHRVNICWTVGVLPALASVLDDSGPGPLEDAFPDIAVRREFLEARKRAVGALMNLSLPEDNKIPIFHCPRLVASLIRVINQDDGEARRGCSAVLLHLSKSKDNKILMAQVPGLLDAITGVIDPKEAPVESKDSDDQMSSDESKGLKTDKTRSEDPAEVSARYDEDPNEFLHVSRQNIFALFGQLVKEKDITAILAKHAYLIDTLVAITRLQESSSQEYGLKVLAHLTRNRANSKILVFKVKDVVPALVFATQSENGESRKYACFALQNLSQDKPCRQQMASADGLLSSICRRIRNAKDEAEKLAALHTLKNLTDEPANLIPMTNTPECFATLMQIAHASDDSVTEVMQYIGCDALATLSHWFRSIATSGQRIGTAKRNDERAKDELFVPSLRVVTWEPWQ